MIEVLQSPIDRAYVGEAMPYTPVPGAGAPASAQLSSFEADLIEAAVSLEGQTAINHKGRASCGFGDTQPSCMKVGLGPDGYDCSGLVIAAISQVIGRPVNEWSPDRRHVRQMYAHAEAEVGTVALGSLLVFGRHYDIDGRSQLVPAHIGIVTRATDQGVIFTHALDSCYKVVHEPLTPQRFNCLLGTMQPESVLR